MFNGHCRDCGETLDHFGICPFADPDCARVERAPVNCGHTVQENTVATRFALSAAEAISHREGSSL
jgi:hypothetical protein